MLGTGLTILALKRLRLISGVVFVADRNNRELKRTAVWKRVAEKHLLSGADQIVCNNLASLRHYSKEHENCIYIPNFSPKPRQELNVQRLHQLAFVGRIEDCKGVFTILQALQKIHNDLSGWKFVFHGCGSARVRLERAIREHPAKDSIFLRNCGESVESTMMESMALVSASRTEGESNALLEGLMHGCAIICTRSAVQGSTLEMFPAPMFVAEVEDEFAEAILSFVRCNKAQSRASEEFVRFWSQRDQAYDPREMWLEVVHRGLVLCTRMS